MPTPAFPRFHLHHGIPSIQCCAQSSEVTQPCHMACCCAVHHVQHDNLAKQAPFTAALAACTRKLHVLVWTDKNQLVQQCSNIQIQPHCLSATTCDHPSTPHTVLTPAGTSFLSCSFCCLQAARASPATMHGLKTYDWQVGF